MYVRFCLLVLMLSAAARAATLTQVPMQGSMVMPMIRYSASMSSLMVMMPTNIPQLTPLLVSHPADQFDPASPWFQALDPSREGRSFSKRYGFMFDSMNTDPLPDNTEMWIRKLSSSPGLDVYRDGTSPAPGVWEPIHGTEGSPVARWWSGTMFHPAFTAAPGTNTYTATFEVYLVDTLTMEEVPGSAAMPMVFQFTNMPDGRPDLDVGMTVAVAWDAAITNYVVEAAPSLTATNWSLVTNQVVEADGHKMVLVPAGEAAGRYYRMRRLP